MYSRKSSKKFKTLSEKIADSFTPRSLKDPENDSEEESNAKFTEIDPDDSDYEQISTTPQQLSIFRKENALLLSEQNDKYRGAISSRKDFGEPSNASSSSDESKISKIKNDENESESSDDEYDDVDVLEKYRKKLKNCQIKDDDKDESFSTDDENYDCEKSNESDSDDVEDSDYGSSGEEISQNEEETVEGQQNLLSETNVSQEVQKGLAVQNQLKLWEKLLEVRIHSQKILLKANSLPQASLHKKLLENSDEYASLTKEANENVEELLNKMVEVQSILTEQYSETKDMVQPKSKKRHATDSSDQPSIKKFSKILEENFENYRPYRNSILQKWDDRTKILTPGAVSKSKSHLDTFNIVQKIETVLLNKSDLIRKSQTIKGNFCLFGDKSKETEQNNEEPGDNKNKAKTCPNIYDDTDFYHQQLRELIEFKTNSSSNPSEMSKQFSELQKLRQKMKKKVDTRASKGRKIRYVVHNKLLNFMAPKDNSGWTQETKTELYRSLFAE